MNCLHLATCSLSATSKVEMDALKGLLNARKQEIKQAAGEKKFVNRAALEEHKLKRIREEEERERTEKVGPGLAANCAHLPAANGGRAC